MIEERIESINEEIELLEEEKELLEEQRAAVEEYYDKLIKETEEMFDEMIEGLEEVLEKWQQLAEIETIANAWKQGGEVFEAMGLTIEDVLNDTPGAFEKFRDAWIQVLMDSENGNQHYAEGIKEWGRQNGQVIDGVVDNYKKLGTEGSAGVEPLKQPLDDATTSTKNLGDAASTSTGTVGGLSEKTGDLAKNASDADENVGNLGETLAEIPEDVNGLNNVSLEGIINQLETLRQKLTEIKLALGSATTGANGEVTLGGGAGSIGGALQEINNMNFDQLIANFEALQAAIMAVSALLGGGEQMGGDIVGSAMGGAEGAATSLTSALNALNSFDFENGIIAQFKALEDEITKVITLLGGGGGEGEGEGGGALTGTSKGGAGEGEGGGADNLIGALEAVKEAADTNIGADAEEGGENVIGDFVALETEIGNNVTALGTEDDESTLIGAIVKTEETSRIHIPPVIDLFAELAETIGNCVTGMEKLITGIEKLGSGGGGNFASSLIASVLKYQGTAKVGKSNLKGNWAYEGGKTLISELGPELVVTPDGKYRVYDKPQLVNLPKGSVIFNHLQTEDILDGKNQISKFGKSNAEGTGLTPITGSALNEMINLANAIGADTDVMRMDIGDIKRSAEEISKTIQNVANNNSTSTNVTFGDLNFTCNGISTPEVLSEVENALSRTFEGMALNAYQKAMAR